MKETFYFPHDNNAHNDPRLMNVFMETGLSGVGLYWIIIELLHQQDDGMISETQFKNYIKWYSSQEVGSKVEQLLSTYLANDLFCLSDDGFIYSKRVLRNKEYRDELSKKRSEAGKKGAEKRLSSIQQQASAKQNLANAKQNLANAKQLNKIKGNKIKENNNINIYSTEGEKDIITTKVATLQEYIKEEFQLDFIKEVYDKYGMNKEDFQEECNCFLDYWKEKSPNGKKERWEKEKTFDPKLRFRTWMRNSKKWSNRVIINSEDEERNKKLKEIEEKKKALFNKI